MPTEIFLFGASSARTRSRLGGASLKLTQLKSRRAHASATLALPPSHADTERASTQNRPIFQPVLKLLARSERGPLITTGNCHYNFHPSRAQSLPPASHTGLGRPPATILVAWNSKLDLSVVTVTSRNST